MDESLEQLLEELEEMLARIQTDADVFDVYVGTNFGTSIYSRFTNGVHTNNVIKNTSHPGREYVIPASAQSEYLGTFFNTSIHYVAGEPGQFIFSYNATPTAAQSHRPVFNHTTHTARVDTPHMYQIGEFIQENTVFIISFVAIGLTIYFTFKFSIRSIKKRRDKKDWDAKLAEVKADARKARINRGYNSDRFN